jgi:hypothetical protein
MQHLATEAHRWYQITWVDWISVAGFPLALVGLFATWMQAKDATDAAKAAQLAISTTEKKLVLKQLMILIPELVWTVDELTAAIEANDSAATRRQLDRWSGQMSIAKGMLFSNDPDAKSQQDKSRSIQEALQEGISLVRVTRAKLPVKAAWDKQPVKVTGDNVARICLNANRSILAIRDDLNIWLGEKSAKAG